MENGALAIPSRLARDFPQDRFGDRHFLSTRQKQQVFLNCGGQVQKRHELADTRGRDVSQPRQLPVLEPATNLLPSALKSNGWFMSSFGV